MCVRLRGVDGRSVFQLILASLVEANPIEGRGRPEVRLAKTESLLFGNRYRANDFVGNEDVLIWMHRRLLLERRKLRPDSRRTKTVEGGIGAISLEAARHFHSKLTEAEKSSQAAAAKLESLARRYKEDFFAQREAIRWRYNSLTNDGEESKIVATVLLKILEAAGLAVNYQTTQLTLPLVEDSEVDEFHREMDIAEGIKTPKK